MFQIDPLSRTPVYEQISAQLETFLLAGVLKPGEQLPSVRGVSLSHSINPRTILHAYADLEARGLITAVPGKGYFVCADAAETLRDQHRSRLGELDEFLRQMALAGVSKSEVLAIVDGAYAQPNEPNAKEEKR